MGFSAVYGTRLDQGSTVNSGAAEPQYLDLTGAAS
jgi:hypothetical protein